MSLFQRYISERLDLPRLSPLYPWFIQATVPADILAAIRLHFLEDAAINAALPNGLWNGKSRAPDMPYGRVQEITASSNPVTGGSRYGMETFQFSVFAASDTQARQLGKQLAALFDGATLVFADGKMGGGFHQMGRPGLIDESGLYRRGQTVWHALYTLTALVNRA